MKDIIVQKYGGTSVGSIEKIRNVAKRIINSRNKGTDIIVVVSAMSGETDRLIKLAYEITEKPSERELDMLVSTGEQVSIALLAIALHSMGMAAVSMNAHQVGIYTDQDFTKARISHINVNPMKKHLKEGKIIIVAGFQGIDEDKNITTLGRGGSDTSAVAIATAIKAKKCEIYTDVDGVYTADPRIVKNAKKLKSITHDEMLELASLGAKVLMHRSIEFAKKYNVALEVRSSFNEEPGTLVVEEDKMMEKIVISGITQKTDEAKINVHGVPDEPGIASKIFKAVADGDIYVNMIVQSASVENKTDISFTVLKSDIDKVRSIIESEKDIFKYSRFSIDPNIGIVSLVGIGMKSHSGVASKAFETLFNNNINIQMISTSEIKISCVVQEDQVKKAVKSLHKEFIET
ncbi:aspartate kinase [Spirochaetota bacterium]